MTQSHPTRLPAAPPGVSVSRQIEVYCERFPAERERLAALLEAVARGDDVHSRGRSSGHLSASAIMLRSGLLLAVYHRYLQRWMQPGGHLDADESPQQAALREALEEAGHPSGRS